VVPFPAFLIEVIPFSIHHVLIKVEPGYTARALKNGGTTFILSIFYPDIDQAPHSLGDFYPDIQLMHFPNFLQFSSGQASGLPGFYSNFPPNTDQGFDMNFRGPLRGQQAIAPQREVLSMLLKFYTALDNVYVIVCGDLLDRTLSMS